MFKAGSNLEGKTPKELFYRDFKQFRVGDMQFGVGQINSMDADREWNKMVAGEYDLCDSNWITVGNGDPTEYMANWYGKSDANFCNYKNAEYDKLYEQLDTEFDEAKRAKIIEQLQQILINDAAVIVHGYYNSSMISDKTVSGANIHTADYLSLIHI